MKVINDGLELKTDKKIQILNISNEVQNIVKKSRIKKGQITIFTNHTTNAVFVNEDEEFLLGDFENFLKERIEGRKFKHDNILERKNCPEDEPINGGAHILSSFYLQPGVSLIVDDSKLKLGKWQSILFIELDGPCPRKHKDKRKVTINIIGE